MSAVFASIHRYTPIQKYAVPTDALTLDMEVVTGAVLADLLVVGAEDALEPRPSR